jgi:hypothetical protein
MGDAAKPEAAVTILPEHATNPLRCSRCIASVTLPTIRDIAWIDAGPARHPHITR